MNDIDDDSLIIYVTKAQLYKIYKPENLDDFQNDNNTHFRRRELGPVYEVVRDANPQKLTIVIKNGLLEDLATLTHSTFFEYNPKLKESEKIFKIEDLGQAEKVIIEKTKKGYKKK
jgi:hypothetical protein